MKLVSYWQTRPKSNENSVWNIFRLLSFLSFCMFNLLQFVVTETEDQFYLSDCIGMRPNPKPYFHLGKI